MVGKSDGSLLDKPSQKYGKQTEDPNDEDYVKGDRVILYKRKRRRFAEKKEKEFNFEGIVIGTTPRFFYAVPNTLNASKVTMRSNEYVEKV